jgi:stage IV sporulation protein FA
MFNEVERVRARRRARLERIRTQTRDGMPPYLNDLVDPVEDRYTPGTLPFAGLMEEEKPPSIPPQEKLGIQVFLSLLLIGSCWLLFQSGIAAPASWKEGVREVMTRDFNFAGVAAWYEARFGRLPSVLPVLSTQKAVPAQSGISQKPWHLPRSWKVVKPFDPTLGKLVLDVGAKGQVVNGETGWVAEVGEKEGFGLTVVVRLAEQREVWFGNLEAVAVSKNDWIRQGDVVGVAKAANENQRLLYLAMIDKNRATDPLEVISFE